MFSPIVFFLFISVKPSSENDIDVFTHSEAGYFCLRIPSILITTKGTLLALGEARMFTCCDNTQIDIVYKRSVDSGKTWSNLQVSYRENTSGANFNWIGKILLQYS